MIALSFVIITLLNFFVTNCLGVRATVSPHYEQVDGSWAQKTLASLSRREKIGQLFIVPTASCFDQPEEALASALLKCPYRMEPEYIKQLITDYKIGGLIFLFKSTPSKQIDAINEYQQLSTIPLLIGQDCEWGLSMRLYNTIRFPRNMTLGALSNKQLIYELGKEIGRQCKAIGLHINFAPVIDVNNNPENPVIHDRSFGDDPQEVGHAGLLMMQGLEDAGVIACAKHFPGHGDTATDSHLGLPLIPHTKERLMQIELVPFKYLIDRGVSAIMNAHLAIPALEQEERRASSLSRAITTQLLEKELGFRGLKITDGIGMQALTDHYESGHIELEAFLAGNDIILCPLDVPRAVKLIGQAILEGKVTEEDLDRRVLKILKIKEWTKCHTFTPINKEQALAQLTTDYALRLKEKLYQEAITVVANKFIPVTNGKTTAVIQIGGERQNQFKETIEHNLACSYFYQANKNDTKATQAIINQLNDMETIIIPLFEINKFSAQHYGISPAQALLSQLAHHNKNIIVVPFGTPYSIPLLKKASTIVLAYEDDPEAQRAAAEIIIGKRKACGKLPINLKW